MTASRTFQNLPSEKQDRILDAALSEFAARGYARASINGIVAAVGIAKGSIFQYFKDKPGLFATVFDFAVGIVKDHLRGVREATRGQDVFTRLERSLVSGLELIQDHPRLFSLYLKVLFEGGIPFRGELVQSIRIFSRDYLMDLLGEGRAAGELDPDLDLETAAFICDAVLERFLVAKAAEHMDTGLGIHRADAAQAQALAARVVATMRQGLGAK